MKKTIIWLLCVAFAFALTACAGSTPAADTEPATESTAATTEPATEPATEAATEAATEPAVDEMPAAYDVVLSDIIAAFPWDYDGIAAYPELSIMYTRTAELNEVGYALVDLDGDGQQELIIGNAGLGSVYDVFTISGEEAVHLFAGSDRNFYTLYQNGFMSCWWSNSAISSGYDFYQLSGSTLELVERVAMDAEHALNIGAIQDLEAATDENCYFVSATTEYADYQAVTAAEANEKIDAHKSANAALEFEFTLLSDYNK